MRIAFIGRGQKGFSLVELMIVVSIIGILAALAVPKFQSFQAKARAAEVKNNLSHGYTLQMSYHGDNDTYGTLQQIGFSLNNVAATGAALAAAPALGRRYAYASANAANTFTITGTAAVGVLGSCQTGAHAVTIDQNKIIGPTAAAPIPGC
jgi:prepilin-type N-terminal cleavage/methylation domain-containing protein